MLTLGGLPAYVRCGFWTLLAYIVRKAGRIEAENECRRRAQWNELCGDWYDMGGPPPERYTGFGMLVDLITLCGFIVAAIVVVFLRNHSPAQ